MEQSNIVVSILDKCAHVRLNKTEENNLNLIVLLFEP